MASQTIDLVTETAVPAVDRHR